MTPVDLEIACHSGNYELAFNIAFSLGRRLTTDELELIVASCVSKGNFYDADKALQKLGRRYTDQELERMLRVRIESGSLALANYPERWGRPLKQEEIDQTVIIGMQKNCDVSQAVFLIRRGMVSRDCISRLVDICIQKALPQTAKHFAEMIGRELKREEINTLIASCRETGYEDRVREAEMLSSV